MKEPRLGDVPGVIDLMSADGRMRCDLESARVSVALAFSGGLSGGLFDEMLAGARPNPSAWEPKGFAEDLFLSTFVGQCFRTQPDVPLDAGGIRRVTRALSLPPKDVRDVEFRRGIVAELLASPEMLTSLERLHVLLCRFRTALEGAHGLGRADGNRRQLEVLQLFKGLIDHMAGMKVARSGLERLRGYGERIQQGEPYRSLADLLDYDEHLATVNLSVRVGADGHIRGFSITSVEEHQDNPFVTSVFRRWLTKFELFIRGFGFGEGEVMARLIDAVFEGVQDEFVRLIELFGHVEFYLGALGFRALALAAGLEVTVPTLVPADSPRVLRRLFNPILLSTGGRVVPCDLVLDRQDATVLITGPNSGGKTRLLQSLGLAQLLAQAGLFVPAREASMSLAGGLVVSLIQETKANQAEGRLGMELVRIRLLFEQLQPGSVVILDELCSGTNPSEGEEIFELVVRMLRKLRPQAFITTHFLAFAARLQREQQIECLRFLQVQLGEDREPTYQFAPGVASTSLAGQTAARLGVTSEHLDALIAQSYARKERG